MSVAQPVLSVIVPVHNTEDYIAACLDSLLAQTLENIEVICIDDGSSDSSAAILDRYGADHAPVIVIHQEAAGVSAARNAGLACARGRYIMFCDSDDSYKPNACEVLYHLIHTSKTDIAVSGFDVHYQAHEEMRESDAHYYDIKFSGLRAIGVDEIFNTNDSLCSKIFKKELIDAFQIEFPFGLHYEDYYFFNCYMAVSKTAYYTKEALYNYNRRPSSIMSQTWEGDIDALDHIRVAILLHDFFVKNSRLSSFGHDFFWEQFIACYSFSKQHSTSADHGVLVCLARDFVQEKKMELACVSQTVQKTLQNLGLLDTSLEQKRSDRLTKVFASVSPFFRDTTTLAEQQTQLMKQNELALSRIQRINALLSVDGSELR